MKLKGLLVLLHQLQRSLHSHQQQVFLLKEQLNHFPQRGKKVKTKMKRKLSSVVEKEETSRLLYYKYRRWGLSLYLYISLYMYVSQR